MKKVTVPNSVIDIGDHAFRHCNQLTAIEIGDNVEDIGIDAFAGCSKLKVVAFTRKSKLLKSLLYTKDYEKWGIQNQD